MRGLSVIVIIGFLAIFTAGGKSNILGLPFVCLLPLSKDDNFVDLKLNSIKNSSLTVHDKKNRPN